MDLVKLYQKYNWVALVLLLVYGAYKTFAPAEVKVVEKERTVTVSDVKTETALRSEIASLKQKIRNYSRQINKDEVIVETKYPDGRVERRIEKKTVTNASGSSYETQNDSDVFVVDKVTGEKKKVENTKNNATVTNPTRLWSTLVGFQYMNKQLIVGQGINIGANLTGMFLGSYSAKDGLSEKDRWDFGGSVIYRY
jgi:hypothetical protein